MKRRVIVYVDGFNLYYGLRRYREWRRYYWLDMVRFFQRFLRDDEVLVRVKYFSARPLDLDKAQRQDQFFKANGANSRFELILGHYPRKHSRCHTCGATNHTFEEKEADVRLALEMASDAYEGACDVAVLVSADSDMGPAVERAQRAGVEVRIFFPPNLESHALARLCKPLYLVGYRTRFAQSLLPDEVLTPRHTIQIPPKWKDYQKG